LLATFSEPLANALRTKLRRLIINEPKLGERIDVHSVDAIGIRLYQSRFGSAKLASREDIAALLREAAKEVSDHKFSQRFLATEWEQIVDAWQLDAWEAYRDAKLKLDFTRDHLAGKEMEIGRYYLKRQEYLAAMNRFKRVIDIAILRIQQLKS
jgi:hypothetical protein